MVNIAKDSDIIEIVSLVLRKAKKKGIKFTLSIYPKFSHNDPNLSSLTLEISSALDNATVKYNLKNPT